MITLDEYKDYLVNWYKYEIDNTEERRNERKEYLNRVYNDDFLQKIIDDTYTFIRQIFDSSTIKKDYCSFPLNNDSPKYISCPYIVGGGFSDIIYIDLDGKFISRYILKYVLGKSLCVSLIDEEIPFDADDEDIISFDYMYYLYLQGFPKNLQELKENLFGNNKAMVKTLQNTYI